jgi:hypothetical protein
VFAGIFPLAGGLGFFYLFYEEVAGPAPLTHNQINWGVGSMLLGVPLLVWSWFHNPRFYRQPTESAGPEELVPAAASAT